MTVGRYVQLFSGSLVLLSLALGAPASPLFHGQGWLWLTSFVGFMTAQSAITRFCPMGMFLRALGVKTVEATE